MGLLLFSRRLNRGGGWSLLSETKGLEFSEEFFLGVVRRLGRDNRIAVRLIHGELGILLSLLGRGATEPELRFQFLDLIGGEFGNVDRVRGSHWIFFRCWLVRW
jgi:hypothetical protein